MSLQFSSFAKMNGGSKNGFEQLRSGQLGSNPNANSANPHYPSVSKPTYEDEFPPLSASVNSSSKSRRLNKSGARIQQKPGETAEKISPLPIERLPMENAMSPRDFPLPASLGKKKEERAETFSPLQIETLPIENASSLYDFSLLASFGNKAEEKAANFSPLQIERLPMESSMSPGHFSFPTSFGKKTDERAEKFSPLQIERLPTESSLTLEDEVSLPPRFRKTGMASRCRRKARVNSFTKNAVGVGNSDCSKCMPKIEPFDICHSESRNFCRREILRPGMVLLKRYITHVEQVKIVKKCQELGLGTGGFYQPSFRNGGRLHWQMMCLGLNWDPETREYGEIRAVDGSKPPDIPHEFSLVAERAILDSHDLIKMDLKEGNVEDILPRMSPNICIVNFYTTSGRLGLHQDRDESMESLLKGLPVVSFSVGDSAEFLYGDQRDINKAERVWLESGDVLIYGGKSRHIFHGVQSIIPDTAPLALLEESNIRPGCLNLTFRQF